MVHRPFHGPDVHLTMSLDSSILITNKLFGSFEFQEFEKSKSVLGCVEAKLLNKIHPVLQCEVVALSPKGTWPRHRNGMFGAGR